MHTKKIMQVVLDGMNELLYDLRSNKRYINAFIYKF